MVDWQGFLKWSLNYHDNTKETEIPPMTEEQKQFLEDAVKSYTIDEVKKMKEILEFLEKNIQEKEQHDQVVEMFNDLIGLLTGIDNAKNFCKIGGIYFILKYALDNNLADELRSYCCIILVDCASNNHFVQNFLSRVEFWKMLDCFEDSGWLIRLRTISALGAIVRGDNMIMKRLLLNQDGFPRLLGFLKQCFTDFDDQQTKKIKTAAKIMSILDDLLKFQIFMDRDIDYLEDQMQVEKYPKVKKYQDFTNFSFLHSMTLLKALNQGADLLLQQADYQNSNNRITLVRTLKSFVRECIRQRALKKKHFKATHKILLEYKKLLQEHLKKDDFYENEMLQLEQTLESMNDLPNQLINKYT